MVIRKLAAVYVMYRKIAINMFLFKENDDFQLVLEARLL